MTRANAAVHGEKWHCEKCETKFYDLKKRGPNNGAVCPTCGTELHRPVKAPRQGARKPQSRSAFGRGARKAPTPVADPPPTK